MSVDGTGGGMKGKVMVRGCAVTAKAAAAHTAGNIAGLIERLLFFVEGDHRREFGIFKA